MTWHVIETTRGREDACSAALERLTGVQGWYPTKTIDCRSAAQKRRSTHNPRYKAPRYRKRAMVAGYVFIESDTLPYHLINEYHKKGTLWLRVLCLGGRAVKISDEQMAEMRSLPAKLQEWLDDIQERKRIRVGDRVRVIDGPFADRIGKARLLEKYSREGSAVVEFDGDNFFEVVLSLDSLEKVAA